MFPGMRNLVTLDIDGTLLPSWRAEGTSEDVVTAPYQTPGRVGRCVTERLLAFDAELVWLTAWRDDANEGFGPILGRLPVLDSDTQDRWWKAQALHDYVAANGPYNHIVWMDDEISEHAQDVDRVIRALSEAGAHLLVIEPDTMRGLQLEDLALADSFLRSGS